MLFAIILLTLSIPFQLRNSYVYVILQEPTIARLNLLRKYPFGSGGGDKIGVMVWITRKDVKRNALPGGGRAFLGVKCTPDKSRTCNHLLRKQALYPIELRGQVLLFPI